MRISRLLLTGSWAGLLAVLAAWGVLLRIDGNVDNFSYFTQQSNMLVAGYYFWQLGYLLIGRERGWRAPPLWLHGAVVVYIIVTGVVYATLLDGSYRQLQDVLSHAAIPILVAIDWLIYGPKSTTPRWWYPLSWSVYPVLYLGFILLRAAVIERPPGSNRYVYPFLNLEAVGAGQFALTVLNFIIGFVALGYLIMGIGKGIEKVQRTCRNARYRATS
ncbi:MAG: hypothetical protein DLM55_02090 [Acidimicrobiales bacterium]|nr:MAG: hypothetical protein DLM55_02090 [Acidimicrobiales bacterium]